MSVDQEDPHHCKCFEILRTHVDTSKTKLESIGFIDTPFQLEQGQKFGLIKEIEEDKQIHIRVMPSGKIEAEIEPSHKYPFAHINSKHSYSAHQQLQNILHKLGIPYIRKWGVPLSCIRPIIKEPFKPTHVKTILGIVLVIVIIAGVAVILAKKGVKV